MDIYYPLNESRVKQHLFSMERFVDEQEYFYEIYFHSVITFALDILTILAIACFFANLSNQANGMTKVLRLYNNFFKFSIYFNSKNYFSYRIKVALDNSNTEEVKYEKMIDCIKFHQDILR